MSANSSGRLCTAFGVSGAGSASRWRGQARRRLRRGDLGRRRGAAPLVAPVAACAGCCAGLGCCAPGAAAGGVGGAMLSRKVAPSTISTAIASAAPSGVPSVRCLALLIPTMKAACANEGERQAEPERPRALVAQYREVLIEASRCLPPPAPISLACMSPARPELLTPAATAMVWPHAPQLSMRSGHFQQRAGRRQRSKMRVWPHKRERAPGEGALLGLGGDRRWQPAGPSNLTLML